MRRREYTLKVYDNKPIYSPIIFLMPLSLSFSSGARQNCQSSKEREVQMLKAERMVVYKKAEATMKDEVERICTSFVDNFKKALQENKLV